VRHKRLSRRGNFSINQNHMETLPNIIREKWQRYEIAPEDTVVLGVS
jgi:hypothetical protein